MELEGSKLNEKFDINIVRKVFDELYLSKINCGLSFFELVLDSRKCSYVVCIKLIFWFCFW